MYLHGVCPSCTLQTIHTPIQKKNTFLEPGDGEINVHKYIYYLKKITYHEKKKIYKKTKK